MNVCSSQINEKLWNRFYESLILLLTYDKSQEKHVKFDEASFELYMNDSNKTLSKKFLDELAYVCDYSSSEDTVTTIAIQNDSRLIYWVVANISQESKVNSFLFDILELLSQVYNATNEQISTLKHQISHRAIVFFIKKLQRYRFILKRTINTCLSILKRQSEEDRIDFTYSRAFIRVVYWLIKD